jgi:hypothetical protein
VIEVAHDCAVLGIPCDTARLFDEPPGDYLLALQLVVARVSLTNRKQNERMERQAR